MPLLEEARRLPEGSPPCETGAWWITVQDCLHLFNAAAERDPKTGDCLPQSLVSTLLRFDRIACDGKKRPLPVDRLYQAVDFCYKAVPEILRSVHTRLVREHSYLPVSQVRELDAACMDWMGRLPGRTMREKLGGRNSVLAVSRSFSTDTLENRVVCRFARIVSEKITKLLETTADKEVFDHGEGSELYLQRMQEFLRICTWGVARSDLALVSPTVSGEPNNVLLNDQSYSKVWRAWQWLRRYDEDIAAVWDTPQQSFLTSIFWVTTSRFISLPGAQMADDFFTVDDGYGIPLGVKGPQFGPTGLFWQETPEMRILIPPRAIGLLPGTIKALIPDDTRKYGFIQSDTGQDYYFQERNLGDGLSFSSLAIGTRVWISPDERNSVANMPVKVVMSERAGQYYSVSLRKCDDELSVKLYRLDGVTWLAGEELASAVYRCPLNIGGEYAHMRGLPFSLTQGEGEIVLSGGFADLAGASFCADAILRDIFKPFGRVSPTGISLLPNPCMSQETKYSITCLGLDFRGAYPKAWSNDGILPLESTLWASRHRMPEEQGWQWLSGCKSRRILPSANHIEFVAFHDLLDDETVLEQGCLSSAAQNMMEGIAANLNLAAGVRIAYSVPDNSHDFSQRTLRSSINMALGTSTPVRRSIAAALAWQESVSFQNSQISDGDVLIVMDGEGTVLNTTVLVAREDKRLKLESPGTCGVYWERRPSPPGGEIEKSLAWRSLCVDYFTLLLSGSSSDRTDLKTVVTYIVDSGIGDAVLAGSEPVHLDFTTGEISSVLKVHRDEELWNEVLTHWKSRFIALLGSWRDGSPLKDLLSDLGRSDNFQILLVGAPFSSENPKFWGEMFKSFSKRFDPRLIYHLSSDDGRLAKGCHCFLQRTEKKLPAWREWLADLSLELIRGGVFDELIILEETAVDPQLGKVIEVQIRESLCLPAGQKSYRFPLVSGNQNQRPLAYDARLESHKFPLKNNCEVNLTLRYQYGMENSYDLRVRPSLLEGDRFPEIRVEWVNSRLEPSVHEVLEPTPQFPDLVRDGLGSDIEKLYDRVRLFDNKFIRMCQRTFDAVSPNDKDILDLSKQLQELARYLRVVSFVPDASEFLKALFRLELIKWIGNFAGLGTNLLPIWFDTRGKSMKKLSDDALATLCGLGRHTPPTVIEFVFRKVSSAKKFQDLDPNHIFCLRSLLQGRFDNRITAHMVRVLDTAQDAYFLNGSAYNKALGSFAYWIWADEDFIFELAAAHETSISLLLDAVERDLNSLAYRVARNAGAEVKSHLYTYPFQYACEILLGLLRLRGTEWGLPFNVKNARIGALAKKVRRIDCLFSKAGWTPMLKSRIRFNTQKPQNLENMSDLAYVLNCYLTGEDGTNFIHLVEIDTDH